MAATAAFMQDQNAGALERATQAIKVDPLNAMNHGTRAMIYNHLGKAPEAATDIKTALDLAPGNPWVVEILSNVFQSVGKTESALRNLALSKPGTTLERCELLLEANLPQLAVADAREYQSQIEGADQAMVASIVARCQ